MRFLIEYLLGVLRPIGPRHSAAAVRHLLRSDGWKPPMILIAATMVLCFVNAGIGLLAGNPAVKVFNFGAVATYLAVGASASAIVMARGSRNLWRFGALGVFRPRWWFEFARFALIACLFARLAAPLFWLVTEGPRNAIATAFRSASDYLFVAFMVFATAGYGLSLATGRARRGRAFECIQYFYGMCCAALLYFPIIVLPLQAGWEDGPVVIAIGLAAASLLVALGLTIRERVNGRAAM